jgi:hypothetical protein
MFALLGFKSQFFNTEVKIMRVVSYEHLFGDNKYVSNKCEQYVVTKDGIKYLPLDIVEEIGFDYEQSAVMEVDFE